MITYQFYDAPPDYPRPKVQLLPAFTLGALGSGGSALWQVLGQALPRLFYRRGRYALLEAMRLCGAGPSSTLLLPALHCRTMLDPAIRLGAKLKLYRLDDALAPDTAHLRSLLSDGVGAGTALLLTHYFGKPQDTTAIRALCDEFGVGLIEDCSHAYFNPARNPRLGVHCDYAIASPYKFVASAEGGLLVAGSTQARLLPPPAPARLLREVRIGAQLAHRFRPEDNVAPRHVEAQWLGLRQRRPLAAGSFRQAAVGDVSGLYRASEEAQGASRVAQLLSKHCNADFVASRRRANYAVWHKATEGLVGCRHLFHEWPADAVPYMFPLILCQPEHHFHLLKHLGLPIWRWDEVAVSECRVSMAYSRSLLHLPCHQSLTSEALQWMTECLKRVLRDA